MVRHSKSHNLGGNAEFPMSVFCCDNFLASLTSGSCHAQDVMYSLYVCAVGVPWLHNDIHQLAGCTRIFRQDVFAHLLTIKLCAQ